MYAETYSIRKLKQLIAYCCLGNVCFLIRCFINKDRRRGIITYVLYSAFDTIMKTLILKYLYRVMTMAFDFSCPICKNVMQMDNSAVGEMGVCPKCDAEVLIQRSPIGSEEPEVDNEDQTQTSFASVGPEVEPDISTSIASRIMVMVFLICVIGFPVIFLFNGFSAFGYSYEGWLTQYESKVKKEDRELSEYQKKLLEDTKSNKGPPDYSQYAVDLPEPTEEEINFGQSLGAGGGEFGSSGSDSGEGDNRGQGSSGGGFDPEKIFADQDKDMDGLLSGDEISERMRPRVAAMDEDEDGAISKEEFLAAMQRFRSSRRERGEGDAPRGDGGSPE